MHKPHKTLRLVADHLKRVGASKASSPSRVWDELEQVSASGDLPAFGHQGYCDQQKRFGAVRHYHGRLIYVVSGELHAELAAEVIRVRSKSAFWIPPLVRHELSVSAGTKFYTVYVHVLLVSHMPPRCWRFGASRLLEQVAHTLSNTPLGSRVTKQNKLLAAVLIDEINNGRLTGI
ncbi:hypothetical protein [Pseudomonas sp. RC10]|uniref:hypothetical protein n=1 Tax=Pseudomonas bambusae TaxID=3139142 RepID=UPI003138BE35